MRVLKPIVNYINSTLQTGKLNGRGFQSGAWYGLSQMIAGVDQDGEQYYAISYNGEDVTPYDVYSVNVYHRCVNVTPFNVPASQFGAGQTVIGVRFNMRAIIFADQERVAMDGNDLAVLFYAGMPSEIKRTEFTLDGLHRIAVSVTSMETEADKVFQGEFKAPLPGQLSTSVLIAVNYSIEIQADRSCLACSDCND